LGAVGAKGVKGAKGERGSVNREGGKGMKGENGPPGPRGLPGKSLAEFYVIVLFSSYCFSDTQNLVSKKSIPVGKTGALNNISSCT